MKAKRIALNSAVYIELSSGSRHVKVFLIRFVDIAAAATPSFVLERPVELIPFSDLKPRKAVTGQVKEKVPDTSFFFFLIDRSSLPEPYV